MPLKAVLLALSLAAGALCASAQTVYRCGNSYGAQPCAGGTTLDVTDRSTPADAARASKAAAQDMKRAEAMEKARLAADRNAPKALVIGPKEAASAPPREPAKPHKGDKKEGPKTPEIFTAAGPKKAQK